MPEEIYETPAGPPPPMTIERPSRFPSEASEEIHNFITQYNRAEEILAEEQDSHVSVW